MSSIGRCPECGETGMQVIKEQELRYWSVRCRMCNYCSNAGDYWIYSGPHDDAEENWLLHCKQCKWNPKNIGGGQ